MSPDPLSTLSRLGLYLWALTRLYCISPQYAPPRLSNKKFLGTPLQKRNVPKTNVDYCIISRLELQIFYFLLSEVELLRVACWSEKYKKKYTVFAFYPVRLVVQSNCGLVSN